MALLRQVMQAHLCSAARDKLEGAALQLCEQHLQLEGWMGPGLQSLADDGLRLGIVSWNAMHRNV